MQSMLLRIIYVVVASTAVLAIPTYGIFTLLMGSAVAMVELPADDDPIRNGFRVTSAREPAALAQAVVSRGDTNDELVPTAWTFTSKANPSPWKGGGSPTTTTLTRSNVGTSLLGSTLTLVATVTGENKNSPPALTVTFHDGGSTLGTVSLITPASGQTSTATFNVNGPFNVNGLSVGTHSISAKYNGDFNDQPSTSNTLIVTIAP